MHVSAQDRGLLYGQSVFETIAIANGKACLLTPHLQRLEFGAKTLSIPFDSIKLRDEIESVVAHSSADKSVLRVTLTMGVGGRGYDNPSNVESTRIIALHDYPQHPSKNWTEGIQLGLADIKLSDQPALAGVKHGNRLEQIMARSQWQSDWQEALLQDNHDCVIEGTQSNVFVVNNDGLRTPELTKSGVAGVMRDYVIQYADSIGASCEVVPLTVADIETADEVFMTNSVIGLWPVKQFQAVSYNGRAFSQKLLTVMQDHGAIPNI